jgi:hypothetical protein
MDFDWMVPPPADLTLPGINVGPGKEFSTIQAALDSFSGGGIINVYPDTYTDTRSVTNAGGQRTVVVNVNRSGSSALNPIYIRAIGAGVILNGGGTANAAFNMHQKQYVVIEGFEITNFTLVGKATNGYGLIEVQDYGAGSNANVIIEDCYIHDNDCTAGGTDWACINTPGCGAVTITNNYLNFSPTVQKGSGVRGNDASSVICEDNIIINPHTGIYYSQAVHNHIYRRNYVQNARLAGLWNRSGRNCLMESNVVEFISGSKESIQAGLFLNDNTDASAISNENSQIINNTSIGNMMGIEMYEQTGTTIANNIVVNSTDAAIYINEDASMGVSIRNNCFFNNAHLYLSSDFGGYSPVWESTYVDGGNITSNPLFVASGDKPTPYYNLQSGSPCRNAGDNLLLGHTDINGATIDSTPDMGAAQF